MYDSKSVSPMEDYRRRNAKSARIDSKRAELQEKRDRLLAEMRATEDPFIRLRRGQELQGVKFDLDQLHAEQLAIWRK